MNSVNWLARGFNASCFLAAISVSSTQLPIEMEQPSMSSGISILVVEDNKELAKSICGHLSDEGYAVVATHDGEEAISLIQRNEFTIVVLDLKLPKLSGSEVLKFAKKNSPQTKLVVLTAYADLTNVTMYRELGADEVIAKPYDVESLLDAIKLLLKKESPPTPLKQ